MENRHDKTHARSEIYRCLGSAFTLPTEGYFPSIAELRAYATHCETVHPPAASSARELLSAAENDDLNEILVEYSHLFIGPFNIPAPPYGSVYLDEGRMMGDSTIKAVEFYRESGLELDESFPDVPDHISVEFEFMQHLCHQQWKAEVNDDVRIALSQVRRQLEFATRFLINWLPRFSASILEHTDNAFYVALISNLTTVIDLDVALIERACRDGS